VSWPNRDVCLVNAQSRGHLLSILDEVADPGAAKIIPYTGPIYFDLKRKKKLFDHKGNTLKPRLQRATYKEFLQHFETGQYTDVTLKRNDTLIKAHRLVLDQFKWFQKQQVDSVNVIDIKIDIEPQVLEQVVRYLYTGVIEGDDKDNIMKLLQASFHFQLDHLKEICECRLSEYYSRSGSLEMARNRGILKLHYAIELANEAHTYEAKRLVEFLLYHIHKHCKRQKLPTLHEDLRKRVKNWSLVDDYDFNDKEVDNLAHERGQHSSAYEFGSSSESTESGIAMWKQIMHLAFPHSSKARRKSELKEAIREDDKANDEYEIKMDSQRKSSDPLDQLACHADVSREVLNSLYAL
jgi:hypothetical protein